MYISTVFILKYVQQCHFSTSSPGSFPVKNVKRGEGKSPGDEIELFLSDCELCSRWVPLSCQSCQSCEPKQNQQQTDWSKLESWTLWLSVKRRIGSNSPTRRTVVVWCYWLTTNNITTLLTNQGQSLTIYNSLWHSVTVINSPFHDYTLFSLLFIHWWLRHESCNGVKRLLTIYMYNKMLTKAAHVKNCRLRIY